MKEELGKTITDLRKKAGLNRKELSVGAGVSYNTLKSIEYGLHGATWYIVEDILDALGYEIIIQKKMKKCLQNNTTYGKV